MQADFFAPTPFVKLVNFVGVSTGDIAYVSSVVSFEFSQIDCANIAPPRSKTLPLKCPQDEAKLYPPSPC